MPRHGRQLPGRARSATRHPSVRRASGDLHAQRPGRLHRRPVCNSQTLMHASPARCRCRRGRRRADGRTRRRQRSGRRRRRPDERARRGPRRDAPVPDGPARPTRPPTRRGPAAASRASAAASVVLRQRHLRRLADRDERALRGQQQLELLHAAVLHVERLPASTVCFGAGGGGNYCVAPGLDRPQLGPRRRARAAPSCQCNERLPLGPLRNGACADTCCSTAQQGPSARRAPSAASPRSRATGFDTHETAWCGAADGNTPAGRAARSTPPARAASAPTSRRCEAVCRSPTDCGSGGPGVQLRLGPATLPANKDIVAGCVTRPGTRPNGSARCSSTPTARARFATERRLHRRLLRRLGLQETACTAGRDGRQVQGSYSVLCCGS